MFYYEPTLRRSLVLSSSVYLSIDEQIGHLCHQGMLQGILLGTSSFHRSVRASFVRTLLREWHTGGSPWFFVLVKFLSPTISLSGKCFVVVTQPSFAFFFLADAWLNLGHPMLGIRGPTLGPHQLHQEPTLGIPGPHQLHMQRQLQLQDGAASSPVGVSDPWDPLAMMTPTTDTRHPTQHQHQRM